MDECVHEFGSWILETVSKIGIQDMRYCSKCHYVDRRTIDPVTRCDVMSNE